MFECYDDIWRDYYAPHLTKWELNQLLAASRHGPSELLESVIKPMAYQPDQGFYLCVDDNVHASGRPFFESRRLTLADPVEWHGKAYFTNGMRIAQHDDPQFNNPSQRIVITPKTIFTVEFDEGGIPFFQDQLGWLRSSTKKMHSKIGQYVSHLRSRYIDFEGLSVVYSGNKSCHFHLVFSTEWLAKRCTPTSYRDGLRDTWSMLHDDFKAYFGLDQNADAQLRFPEWFRRLPTGLRLIEPKRGKPNWRQAFGVPFGEYVPQLVLWEHFFKRAGTATNSVFDPALFTRDVVEAKRATKSKQQVITETNFAPTAPARAYCEDRMRAAFPDFPRFHSFGEVNGETRAFFMNCIGDNTPASYMGWDFSTVMIQGSNPLNLTPKTAPRLPAKLGDMLATWVDEYEAMTATVGDRERTEVEQAFAEAALDHGSAIKAVGKLLHKLITNPEESRDFLVAPEGISKSRSLIASTRQAINALHRTGNPELVMYAFATYELAEEKCREFNASYASNPHIAGIVLKSFSKLYEDAAEDLGLSVITPELAAQMGFNSPYEAIQAQQPAVIDWLRDYYQSLHSGLRGAFPVIFSVHAVAQEWVKTTNTRKMFAPSFWQRDLEPQVRHYRTRQETQLGLLIHDEISAEDLLIAVPEPVAQWVDDLRAFAPAAFVTNSTTTEKVIAYLTFAETNPAPISFERASELADILSWESVVTTQYSGEYGEPREGDIYAARAGNRWRINRRTWPHSAAHKTLVLTTERVPTLIARHLGEWNVIELDTQRIKKDIVTTVPDRRITARNLATRVLEEQAEYEARTGRKLKVISNKVSHIANTKTHASAKGSNAYLGQPVLQTMTLMPPAQYEFYEALNALVGRSDMARIRHIDEYNQTAGRNLGFRKRDGADHILLISHRLCRCLDGEPKMNARYVMQEIVSSAQTRRAKSAVAESEAFKVHQTGAKLRLQQFQAALRAHHNQFNGMV